ncbi:MAG: hypothetical protein HC822_03950 [Oscillochloris sp.]|nr:hypothetical protein [Oscillochloris sp.]
MRLFHVILPAILLVLSFGTQASAAQAQSDSRCFPETGFCISGAIRTYWERNGGLAVFGFPITEQRIETIEGTWTGPVQWFERDRLEDHSNEGIGVLAGRLGARYLELRGTPWESFPPPPNAGDPHQCRYFPVTAHRLCQPFLGYWERNGGLERFGYPISESMGELIEGKLYNVQYFERRRMEYHPEHVGTAYEILLGRLGWDVFVLEGQNPICPPAPAAIEATAQHYRAELGCPSAGLRVDVSMAWQPFEGGMMLWVQNEDFSGGKIFVVYYDATTGRYYWHVFNDTYSEGEPVNQGVNPPPGLLVPQRGFGKVWQDNPWVRNLMGYATLPERPDVGLVQPFSEGRALMIYRYGQDMVAVLFPPPVGGGDGRAIERTPAR